MFVFCRGWKAFLWSAITLLYLAGPASFARELVFAAIPDLHCLDDFLLDPVPGSFTAKLDRYFHAVKSADPDFVIMPGDLGRQHWWNPADACKLDGTLQSRIMGCADIAYPALKARMALNGLTSVYVGVADHDIGDNDWPLGARSDAVKYFKAAFAKHFTKLGDGSPRFKGKIGNVPMRPVGTPYEFTSYAFLAGETLFVAVDQFQQVNSTAIAGVYGSVAPTVASNDGHLQWLDSLLAAARSDPAITKIIVFGGVPVLAPLRAHQTSNMLLELGEKSEFWRVLRKHHVNLYMSGEVHTTTAMRDRSTRLLQVISAGTCEGTEGFVTGHLFADRIEIRHHVLTPAGSAQLTAVDSTLATVTSPGIRRITSTGSALKLIDPDGLLVHYDMDEAPLSDAANHGSFGESYDSQKVDIGFAQHGGLKGAAWFSRAKGSKIRTEMTNPIGEDLPRTISTWVWTSRKSEASYIYPYGRTKRKGGGFRLLMSQGVLGLEYDDLKRVHAEQGTLRINDSRWHHIAVTFPGRGFDVNAVQFFIDGKPYSHAPIPEEVVNTYIGGDQLTIGSAPENSSAEGWEGAIDDFALWGSALSGPMVSAVENCATMFSYNASDMELLFRAYRHKWNKSFIIDGVSWKYATGLGGILGACRRTAASAQYVLRLDGAGNGLVGLPVLAAAP